MVVLLTEHTLKQSNVNKPLINVQQLRRCSGNKLLYSLVPSLYFQLGLISHIISNISHAILDGITFSAYAICATLYLDCALKRRSNQLFLKIKFNIWEEKNIKTSIDNIMHILLILKLMLSLQFSSLTFSL